LLTANLKPDALFPVQHHRPLDLRQAWLRYVVEVQEWRVEQEMDSDSVVISIPCAVARANRSCWFLPVRRTLATRCSAGPSFPYCKGDTQWFPQL
jgi:hypothetical protein